MVGPLRTTLASLLEKFSTPEGEKKLKIASLWEEVLGTYARGTRVLDMKNHILFVGVPNNTHAQELKLRFQRIFLEKFAERFGEKIKDIRFVLTH